MTMQLSNDRRTLWAAVYAAAVAASRPFPAEIADRAVNEYDTRQGRTGNYGAEPNL